MSATGIGNGYDTQQGPRKLPVVDAEQRSWSYWFADGLPNLVAGVLCVLVAILFVVLSHHRDSRSPIVFAVMAAATALFILVLVRFRQMIEWLKARITYPRTGYAASPYFTYSTEASVPADLAMLNLSSAPKQGILPDAAEVARDAQDRQGRMWITLAFYCVALLCAAFIHERWICVALGIVAGAGMWIPTRKNERLSWAVTFSLPFAAMFLFLIAGSDGPSRITERLGFFFAGAGFMLALTGALTLLRYVRRNRVVNE